MSERPKITITGGAGFGDNGKGVDTYRRAHNILQELGVYGEDGYRDRMRDAPLQVLAEEPVLLNVSPFGGGNTGWAFILDSGESEDLHLLPPATVFAPYTISHLGASKNVHVGRLLAEVEHVRGNSGADIIPGKNLYVDSLATITTDQCAEVDKAVAGKIRGTKAGNAPAWALRAMRWDVRAADLFHLDDAEVRGDIVQGIEAYNLLLEYYSVGGHSYRTFSVDEVFDQLDGWARVLGEEAVVDGSYLINLARGNPRAHILVTAPHGHGLDNMRGSVRRSVAYGISPADIVNGAHLSLEEAAQARWVVVMKSNETRSGSGLFPGEYLDRRADFLRDLVGDYGVTSGNARREGPCNLGLVRDQVDLITQSREVDVTLAIRRIDAFGEFMDEFGPQRAVIGHRTRYGADNVIHFPYDVREDKIVWSEPYQWGTINTEQRNAMIHDGWDAYPTGLQDFLQLAAAVTGAPVSSIGLGKKRAETATKGLYEATFDAANR